jgi:4-hydroxy-2-oxoheptanedioate aldolase
VDLPKNRFKVALRARRQQIGLWCSLASAYAVDIVAGSGFDWLLLDTEHAPNDIEAVLAQLQTVAGHEVSAVVRPASNDVVLIKRYLDIGAQTLLMPCIQTSEEAQAAVAAMLYPPEGVRGVSGLTRASRFGRVEGYAKRAADELCLLVQIETQMGLDALEVIATTRGVDGVFIGPSDLAASLGHVGELGHPVVVAAIEKAVQRLKALGVPAGLLTADPDVAERYIESGSIFTAVGIDLEVLARGTEKLARRFKSK